jgi:putative transposase
MANSEVYPEILAKIAAVAHIRSHQGLVHSPQSTKFGSDLHKQMFGLNIHVGRGSYRWLNGEIDVEIRDFDMPRANRVFSGGRVWHITHRCHRRSFLLKFVRDRRRWRHWLFEARRRYGLSVLNYMCTSNHVHVLCAISGRTAQEFNARKGRNGAFWEDRYHATAVQTDGHLARCIAYIDLNMVRAGVVQHPRDWEVSGYNEIQIPWQRKGIIDFRLLMKLLVGDNDSTRRNPLWTESLAVGDETYLEEIRTVLGVRGLHRQISIDKGIRCLREPICPNYRFPSQN